MKMIKTFFIGVLTLSMCVTVSAQSKTFVGNGSEKFSEFETKAIVLERARIRSELDAVDQASRFVMECDENLSAEIARSVAGRILDIQSSQVLIDENRYSAPFTASVHSENIQGALKEIDDSVQNRKLFVDQFEDLEEELEQIRNMPAESRTREILKRVSDNEKRLALMRNFVPISWAESAGSGSKKNLFGYVENLTEAQNGTLYFELKDPTSDAKIRCTLIARLNNKRPELKKLLEGNSPMYLYGMLTRFQGKVSLMVWNVYL